jgi:hypothetical protein
MVAIVSLRLFPVFPGSPTQHSEMAPNLETTLAGEWVEMKDEGKCTLAGISWV